MYTPQKAADWLSQRLGRAISRQTVQAYMRAGDLPATNIGAGEKQARWVIMDDDLDTFVQRIADNGGELPTPTNGWPQRTGVRQGIGRGKGERRKKADPD